MSLTPSFYWTDRVPNPEAKEMPPEYKPSNGPSDSTLILRGHGEGSGANPYVDSGPSTRSFHRFQEAYMNMHNYLFPTLYAGETLDSDKHLKTDQICLIPKSGAGLEQSHPEPTIWTNFFPKRS
ncbi:hypothetical protein MGN70_009901 [Eutypa lata]|nr:hypothetical protein MGN70_009901 [Eutypa lata]